MPGSTESNGAASAPAKPANIAPTPNTCRNNRPISTPRDAIITGLEAPARMRMPVRVPWITAASPAAISSPTTISATR